MTAILIISNGASNSYLWVDQFSSSCLSFFSHFFAFWLWEREPLLQGLCSLFSIMYLRVIGVTVLINELNPPTAAFYLQTLVCRGRIALSRWPINEKQVYQLWRKKQAVLATVALWLPEAAWWQEWVILQAVTEGSPASERHSGTSPAFGAGHKKLIILCYSFSSVTFHPRVCFLQKTSYIHQKWQNTDLM